MLARVGFEQFPEIGAARGEHHFVGGEGAAIAGEGDVDEVLLVAEVPERRQDAGMEVVPAQRVLLLGALLAPHRARCLRHCFSRHDSLPYESVRMRSRLFSSVLFDFPTTTF